MMKGALENVEVLHFFFISVLWGDLVLSPSHSPSLPLAYSHSCGINDKEEWIQRAVGRRCARGGGWMGNGPPQLNVSGSSVAAG